MSIPSRWMLVGERPLCCGSVPRVLAGRYTALSSTTLCRSGFAFLLRRVSRTLLGGLYGPQPYRFCAGDPSQLCLVRSRLVWSGTSCRHSSFSRIVYSLPLFILPHSVVVPLVLFYHPLDDEGALCALSSFLFCFLSETPPSHPSAAPPSACRTSIRATQRTTHQVGLGLASSPHASVFSRFGRRRRW